MIKSVEVVKIKMLSEISFVGFVKTSGGSGGRSPPVAEGEKILGLIKPPP